MLDETYFTVTVWLTSTQVQAVLSIISLLSILSCQTETLHVIRNRRHEKDTLCRITISARSMLHLLNSLTCCLCAFQTRVVLQVAFEHRYKGVYLVMAFDHRVKYYRY